MNFFLPILEVQDLRLQNFDLTGSPTTHFCFFTNIYLFDTTPTLELFVNIFSKTNSHERPLLIFH